MSDRMPVAKIGKKIFTGEVVSDKMEKTIVVAITSRRMHPLYKKYVVHTKKIKAHDEQNDAHIGDTVRVIESRPMSKEKRWRLLEIVQRAK
jgi:small subunit ribosomal protein S17